ncbi:hypothetical protein KY329_03820 [Candidatus Woesearchaeota archaeon]|nr:hypothetical protein [Candidatus Woesearchaeota archaeon]
MVNKNIAYALFVMVILIAIGSFVWSISVSNSAGNYVSTGVGRYVAGSTIVQLSPQDACELAGCMPSVPASVMRNEYGVYLAECECPEGRRAIPLVQRVTV